MQLVHIAGSNGLKKSDEREIKHPEAFGRPNKKNKNRKQKSCANRTK